MIRSVIMTIQYFFRCTWISSRGWSCTLVQVHHLWFSVFLRVVVSLRFSCFVCLLFLVAFSLFLSFTPLYFTVWWDSFSSFISVCSTSDFPLVKMAGDSGVAGNAHSSYDTWFQASQSCRFLFLFFVCAFWIICLLSCCIVYSLFGWVCAVRIMVMGWLEFL